MVAHMIPAAEHVADDVLEVLPRLELLLLGLELLLLRLELLLPGLELLLLGVVLRHLLANLTTDSPPPTVPLSL